MDEPAGDAEIITGYMYRKRGGQLRKGNTNARPGGFGDWVLE